MTAPLDPTPRFHPIVKHREQFRVAPNLLDYREERARFTWAGARQRLDGLPGGRGLNIAHEAVDRHASGPLRDRVAIRWRGRHGAVRELSYAALAAETNRFANALRALGVGKGDAVFALAGRIPELYVAALGTLKNDERLLPALLPRSGPTRSASVSRSAARAC